MFDITSIMLKNIAVPKSNTLNAIIISVLVLFLFLIIHSFTKTRCIYLMLISIEHRDEKGIKSLGW